MTKQKDVVFELTGKERARRAKGFMGSDRIPLLYFNSDKEQSDILLLDVSMHFMGENRDLSEWGFTWRRADETMGQPKMEILTSWAAVTRRPR